MNQIYETIVKQIAGSEKAHEKATESIRDQCLKQAKGKADTYADCAERYWKKLEKESRLFSLKTEFELKKAQECLSKGSDQKTFEGCRDNATKAIDSHVKSYLEVLSKIAS